MSILRTATGALLRNKSRTVLTSLGITIGIAAVIAMVSAGQGAQSRLDSAFGVIGPNLVIGFSGQKTKSGLNVNAGEGAFTQDDAAAIREELRSIIVGCSEVSQFPIMASSSTNNYGTALVGGVPEVFNIRRWKLRYGTPYTQENLKRQDKVCVLGSTVADKLFPNSNPVDKPLRINWPGNSQTFRVIGVLEKKGATFGNDQDDIIMTPMSTLLRKVMGTDKCQLLLIEARSTEYVPEVERQVERILRERQRLKPNDTANFRIQSMQEYANIASLLTSTLSALIYAIASISLLVGGIGVMNIMLVSVTERTREIGIRMAVGARPTDILAQFLTEAILLALFGGAIGISLGVLCSYLIAWKLGWAFIITPGSVLVAFATSAAVGIFFGFYPARKASMLDPIESLRYE